MFILKVYLNAKWLFEVFFCSFVDGYTFAIYFLVYLTPLPPLTSVCGRFGCQPFAKGVDLRTTTLYKIF